METELINGIINNIDIVKNEEDTRALVQRCFASADPVIISFLNAHGINVCYGNKEFATSLLHSDIILRDGIGMQMLFKALNTDAGLNMNGTDFIPDFLNRSKGQSIGIMGTQDPYLARAAAILKESGHHVVVCEDGFKDKTVYLKLAESFRPKIIVLAMGMPRQELISVYLKENLSYNAILINGGAVIDFLGGKVKRAPEWMQKTGMEWLYRLLNEPRRLFNRYVIGNFVFLYRVRGIKRKFKPVTKQQPGYKL
jgi:exopolysaccharide biosynthesis WecB/TagA/CpsF family protein